MTHSDRNISAFVASVLLSEQDPYPMTVDDAAYTMRCWRSEGIDYPKTMTAAVLAYTWNRMLEADQTSAAQQEANK